jgi:hypothetical protein
MNFVLHLIKKQDNQRNLIYIKSIKFVCQVHISKSCFEIACNKKKVYNKNVYYIINNF